MAAEPGHKVLECGAATGYNARLLGELVAPHGQVWTLDVDQDLVDNARTNLLGTRATNVTALLGDGAQGLPAQAPFDRIQFTVGAGDIPTKVLDQLAPGGRLVLPMRIRGSISRSFAFERDNDAWRTVSTEMMTFVPMRNGASNDVRTMVDMAGEGGIRLETYTEQAVDHEAIRRALEQPPVEVYTDVNFYKGSSYEWLYLYLAYVLPNGLSRMPGDRAGLSPNFGWGSMAALDTDTLAYLTKRVDEDEQGEFWQLGIVGHGSRAAALADRVATEIARTEPNTRRLPPATKERHRSCRTTRGTSSTPWPHASPLTTQNAACRWRSSGRFRYSRLPRRPAKQPKPSLGPAAPTRVRATATRGRTPRRKSPT